MRRMILTLVLLAGLTTSVALAQSDGPAVTHGPISGEITPTSAVLWARGSEEGTLTFEIADNPDFAGDLLAFTVDVDESGDFTGEVLAEGLTPGQAYTYRVTLSTGDQTGEPVTGQFHTAPAPDEAAPFSFTFGSGIGGQGYCRNPETGWTIFETMLAEAPDFFLMMGDGVYVDSACPSDEGRNVPGAEGPYRDLDGFRTRYRYHLEDPHYAALLAQTPTYVTWDDHEILDNFGGPELSRINPQLLADGRQVFFEYWPVMGTEDDPFRLYRSVSYGANADFFILDLRSYRDPLVNWDPSPITLEHKTMLGAEQFAWLEGALSESTATWKFIVSSVPLSYPTGWPQPQVEGHDGWANGADRSGYETELMALLYYIESHNIENVVFLSADAHWPYAISYDPDRDGNVDFYELGSSPMSSIPLPPGDIDQTFNPTVLYAEGEFMGDHFNFGHVMVSEDGALTFRVVRHDGETLYSLTLTPQ